MNLEQVKQLAQSILNCFEKSVDKKNGSADCKCGKCNSYRKAREIVNGITNNVKICRPADSEAVADSAQAASDKARCASSTGSVVVKLEVIHDKDTGLSLNQYSWFEGSEWKMQCEVANRPAAYRGINQYGSPAYTVMAYDEAIDRPLAETKRAAMEMSLNAKPQNK